jgi:DNA/RNA-binding domain of Phe-tRNA-synthetase-like protein
VKRLAYEVSTEIFRDFPGYRLGVAVFEGLDNSNLHPGLDALLREAETSVRDRVRGNVAEHERVAPWREAYRRFGAKPGEHRSSIESLLRRVLKGDSLPAINPLVDIGNAVSLELLLPAGVHPLRHADTRISLRYAREGDRFLASEREPAEAVAAGEVVLADSNEVLTRRWTWRQSVTTRTLPESRCVLFNADGLPPAGEGDVASALGRIGKLVQEFCGGTLVHRAILSAAAPRFDIEWEAR